MERRVPKIFITLGVLALVVGVIFGTLAGVQAIFPDFLKEVLAFNRMRPFHVSTVVGWIILTATGGVYYYLANVLKVKLYSPKLMTTHLVLFTLCAIGIYISFASGKMGGREYLSYLPYISVPILLGWFIFGFNYFKTLLKQVQGWPVYLWMWGTGIVFMCYHFSEAHFWMIPHFRDNFVRDITVQWKSYGSFVGSWNMLVYGTAIFLMAKIKNDDKGVAHGKTAFFFYFLGLTNLMFGWAHHTYFIPTQPWIRVIAYITSMTEWIILVKMIISWSRSLSKEAKIQNNLSYKLLMSTDVWVFFNLFLALLISIPSIQAITHGTHITVAHSMGTTIGINTSILLASVLFILNKEHKERMERNAMWLKAGYWIFNISLVAFFISLILGGMVRGTTEPDVPFSQMQENILPYMKVFLFSGYGILVGILLIAIPSLGALFSKPEN